MAVSTAERRQARRQAEEVSALEAPGVGASGRIGQNLTDAVVRAFTSRRDPLMVVRVRLEGLVPLLRDAMLASHLTAIRRFHAKPASAAVGSLELATSVYRSTLRVLRLRAGVPVATLRELADQYEADALLIVKGASDAAEQALGRTILRITEQGLHVRDGARELRKTMVRQGFARDDRLAGQLRAHRLEALFRTQTQLAYAAGRHIEESDAFTQEFLWGYKYVTVGDERVRPSHAALDGVTLPKDDPFWQTNTPPNGWNCRCQLISIFAERTVQPAPRPFELEGKTVVPGADSGFQWHPRDLIGVGARGAV